MSFINGKVALVTGGASGIGMITAREFLKNDAKGVTIADVDAERGQNVADELAKEFGARRVLFVKTDVTRQKEVEGAFDRTIANFKNLDIVLNAAGILNDKIWERQIDINLKGTIYSSLLAFDKYLPAHKTGDEGVIINMSSVASFGANDPVPVYAATKSGVIGLSKSLGTQNHYKRTKVRVLTICPSPTETPLMTEISGRFLGIQYENLVTEVLADFPCQQPIAVAEGIVTAIEEGRNGSVWIVHGGKTFETKLPDVYELLKN